MSCDDIGGAVDAFDEKERISADIRDGGVTAGVGDLVGGGDCEDADAAFVVVAADVVNIRPNRDRGSIRRETYPMSTFFARLISRNIQSNLIPRRSVEFEDANTAYVTCAGDVVRTRPNRDHSSIRGDTYTISTEFIRMRPDNIRPQLTPTCSIEFVDADAAYVIGAGDVEP